MAWTCIPSSPPSSWRHRSYRAISSTALSSRSMAARATENTALADRAGSPLSPDWIRQSASQAAQTLLSRYQRITLVEERQGWRRLGSPSSLSRRRRSRHDIGGRRLAVHGVAVGDIDHWVQNGFIARLDAVAHFNLSSKIARHRHFVQTDDSILVHCDMQSVSIEDEGGSRNHEGWDLAWDVQFDRAIDPRRQGSGRGGHGDPDDQCSRALLQSVGNPRGLSGKGPIRHFGNPNDGVVAIVESECLI